MLPRFIGTNYTTLDDEDTVRRLRTAGAEWHTISLKPPRTGDVPPTLPHVVQGISEHRTKWLGLRNDSTPFAYELRRSTPEMVTVQYAVPTKRMERKVRTNLSGAINGIGFGDGASGLPVSEGCTLGIGTVRMSLPSMQPLRSEFPFPPTNALIGTLHRHAIRDTKTVIQLMVQPLAGNPVRRRWKGYWTRQHCDFLRKEKEQLWGSRKPTRIEKNQAHAIEQKHRYPQYRVTIRVVVVGPPDAEAAWVGGRVNELTSGFAIYTNETTGQSLRASPLQVYRESQLVRVATDIAQRQFNHAHTFRVSVPELGGLLAVPSRRQQNLGRAQP